MEVYNTYYQKGFIEGIAQKLITFGEATGNTLLLTNIASTGHYEYNAFFNRLTSLSNRRDISDTSTALTPVTLTQASNTGVKLNRYMTPVQMTEDAFKKIGKDPGEMVYDVGVMAGQDRIQEYINTTLTALANALANQSSTNYTSVCAASTTTMTATNLNTGLTLMGDRASDVRFLVMHSKVYHDLIAQAISDKIYEEAGRVVYGGVPGTFGRPVYVTDSDSLVTTDGTNTAYYTLGLTEGAAIVNQSEPDSVLVEKIGGYHNIMTRIQSEYAYNLKLKGFEWDTSNGGINPTTANVATGSNWDIVVTSYKNLPGIVIKSL